MQVFLLFLILVTFSYGQSPQDRAKQMLARMSIDDKIAMVHGYGGSPYVGYVAPNTRLGIPAMKLNDGPQGFRDDNTGHQGTTTQWPSALSVAASWDPQLLYEWGQAMGAEFAGKGANIQLGPGVNVARVPVNGRNFEYVSGEDPFLGSTLVAPLVKGIQSKGVIANAKHFIHNNQETDRGDVSANVDERTTMEIYMPPFEAAASAGVLSVMCSYNKINGIYACENHETLTTMLKGYSNFTGWVMSDWGATHSTQGSAIGGLDQEMPDGGFFGDNLKKAIQQGQVPQARLDDMCLRMLTALYAIGEFDHPVSGNINNDVTSAAHNELTRRIITQSAALVKNKNNLLPLSLTGIKRMAVFNPSASSSIITGGDGSGRVTPKYQISPLNGLLLAASNGTSSRGPCFFDQPNIDYFQSGSPAIQCSDAQACCKACQERLDCNAWTYYENTCYLKPDNSGRTPSQGRQSGTVPPVKTPFPINYYGGSDVNAAVTLARSADVAVCVLATTSSEGSDRPNLDLHSNEISICQAVAKVTKTVAVVITPGAVLTNWAEPDVDALLIAWMPGQEEGNGIADLLFGKVNPSGKLPVTLPNKENEVGFTREEYPGVNLQSYYTEKLNVGYRWYATNKVTPRFPFGFGLSYTTFSLDAFSVQGRRISVTLTNTGKVEGAEVVQVYVGFPASAGEPPIQLKGFQKVNLNPGGKQALTFNLSDRDISIWDATAHKWTIVSGSYTIYVGTSSQDLPLKQTVQYP